MLNIKNILKRSFPVSHIIFPEYNPTTIKAGIIHFSVGNFHRSHQALYTHLCLNIPGQEIWGICGIGIMPSDKAFADAFREQECIYTLTECFSNGSKKVRIITSILEYIYAPESPLLALDRLTDPAIKIVSLTITEGGYHIDLKNGMFDFNHIDISYDINNQMQPRTVFGYITKALDIRRKKGIAPFTILSCDNLQHNGDVARKSIISFAKAINPDLADWINEKVTFPNSMVDRITPAVTHEDIEWLRQSNNIDDNVPVFCEDYIQWVIEDNFCAGRPSWDSVGVMFTKDVSDYETAKLRLLNASHSMLAYTAELSGYNLVHEAMKDELFRHYLREFMQEEVIPLLKSPDKIDLTTYKETILERFSNPAVKDQVIRLCNDGASKLPVFIIPTLLDNLVHERIPRLIAFMLACYRKYLMSHIGDELFFKMNEPAMDKTDVEIITGDYLYNSLNIKPFVSINFTEHPLFIDLYMEYCEKLNRRGALKLLSEILATRI